MFSFLSKNFDIACCLSVVPTAYLLDNGTLGEKYVKHFLILSVLSKVKVK